MLYVEHGGAGERKNIDSRTVMLTLSHVETGWINTIAIVFSLKLGRLSEPKDQRGILDALAELLRRQVPSAKDRSVVNVGSFWDVDVTDDRFRIIAVARDQDIDALIGQLHAIDSGQFPSGVLAGSHVATSGLQLRDDYVLVTSLIRRALWGYVSQDTMAFSSAQLAEYWRRFSSSASKSLLLLGSRQSISKIERGFGGRQRLTAHGSRVWRPIEAYTIGGSGWNGWGFRSTAWHLLTAMLDGIYYERAAAQGIPYEFIDSRDFVGFLARGTAHSVCDGLFSTPPTENEFRVVQSFIVSRFADLVSGKSRCSRLAGFDDFDGASYGHLGVDSIGSAERYFRDVGLDELVRFYGLVRALPRTSLVLG